MTPHRIRYDTLARTIADGLSRGAVRVSGTRFEWHCEGNCQSPVCREIFAHPTPRPEARTRWVNIPERGRPLWLTLWVRCRQCDACRKRRASKWSAKCRAEMQTGTRNWFGTLTASPENHYVALCRARSNLDRQGINYDALDYGDQFRELCKAYSRDITLYLKRVRKQSRARFRYFIVTERHKSGLPHWHMVIHEQGTPVRHAILSQQWKLGFTKWKLIPTDDVAPARYCAKYLSKSLATRVRASQYYGTGVVRSLSIESFLNEREKNAPKKNTNESEVICRTETNDWAKCVPSTSDRAHSKPNEPTFFAALRIGQNAKAGTAMVAEQTIEEDKINALRSSLAQPRNSATCPWYAVRHRPASPGCAGCTHFVAEDTPCPVAIGVRLGWGHPEARSRITNSMLPDG